MFNMSFSNTDTIAEQLENKVKLISVLEQNAASKYAKDNGGQTPAPPNNSGASSIMDDINNRKAPLDIRSQTEILKKIRENKEK